MQEQYKIIKNYRDNEQLRNRFNKLAEETFGLNFEDWYQNKYWGDNYNPYSIVHNGEIIANVSVNKTNFLWNGKEVHFIQLGTVMTKEGYRNQGFIRMIMQEIEKDCKDSDAMYLFANDSVLQFYPKFGFRPAKEYQYAKQISTTKQGTMVQVPMCGKKQWEMLKLAMEENTFFQSFDMIDNPELFLFYVTKFMQENVYYHEETNTYVIAEVEGEELFIHAVFSHAEITLNQVIESFGSDIKKVALGFAPKDKEEYVMEERKEEDCTFFVKGELFERFEEEKLMVPTLAHA